MISEVIMPQMGADMKEGTILRWLKQEGQDVQRGEPIAEIETDKANIEIEAYGSGVFRKVLSQEGATVPVGDVIALIAAPDDDLSKYEGASQSTPVEAITADAAATTSPPAAASPSPLEERGIEDDRSSGQASSEPPSARPEALEGRGTVSTTPASPTPLAERGTGGERLRASPVARRLASESGVDLSRIQGTGPDGRIVKRDVESAQTAHDSARAEAPTQDQVEDVALTRMRQTIARRMQQSKQTAPHYYLTVEIDMTEAMAARAAVNESLGEAGRITINDLLILATAKALLRHPRFNAWWLDDHLQLHSRVNIGIAVALDDGLVVPAVLDCAAKGLIRLSNEARDVAERARNGALSPEEYSAATFTISNLGAFGVDLLIPIINPPQVAILGAGAAREKPVVRDGQVVVRRLMSIVLAGDHRATDGAEGARFLATLRQMLETPALMLA